jgi:hypothetical protein
MGLVEKSEIGTLGLLEADYQQSRPDIFRTVLRHMKSQAGWSSTPFYANKVLGKLLLMLELPKAELIMKGSTFQEEIDTSFPDTPEPYLMDSMAAY